MMQTTTTRGKLKINQKNKSVTPSNEQTVWKHIGGRTLLHGRHLPRLPLGNVGIEVSSIFKHYPPPET